MLWHIIVITILLLSLLVWIRIISKSTKTLKASKLYLEKARHDSFLAKRNKSTLISNMKLSINAPINSMVGFSSLLSTCDPKNKAEIVQYSNIISMSSEQVIAIVSQVTGASLASSSTQNEQNEDLDIVSFALHFLDNFQKKRHQAIHHRLNCKHYGLTLNVNSKILDQVLYNLFINFDNYSPNSVLTLSIEKTDDNKCKLSVSMIDASLSEQFKRQIAKNLDDSCSIRPGMSIELSICKFLLTNLGSSLKFNSEDGKFISFYFTVPLKKKEGQL